MMIPIVDKVWFLAPDTPAYPYCNCLYIDDECPTLIDLGAGGRAFRSLNGKLISLCLISHGHFDHLHGDIMFRQAKFMAGIEEAKIYKDEEAYNTFHGYTLWKELMPSIDRDNLGEVVPLPNDVLVKPGFRPIPISGCFSDGQIIDIGTYKLTCIHLPGHTAGHYGFWFEKERILFSGDLDLSFRGPWYSCNTSDIGDLLNSIAKIKQLNPSVIVTSHRRQTQTNNLHEKLDRFAQIVINRENLIYDLLTQPHSLEQLSKYYLVFPHARNVYEQFWDKIALQKHLKHMLGLNTIQEIAPGYYQKS